MFGGDGLGLEGELFGAHLFVGGDVVLVLQRQIDIVVAVHQTPTHVIVDLERQGHVAASDSAGLQRDSHLTTRLFLQ